MEFGIQHMSLEISFLSMLFPINHVDRLPLGSCCLLRFLGMDTNFDFISINGANRVSQWVTYG